MYLTLNQRPNISLEESRSILNNSSNKKRETYPRNIGNMEKFLAKKNPNDYQSIQYGIML
jgi:hypothetical protein